MVTTTSFLGLIKPDYEDQADVGIMNANSDKIDNGVKTAMQGRAVYNLLDNSDFRNPVNQRGQTSYTGSGYTIDRWRSWDSGFSMTVSSGSITVSGGMLNQYIEKSLSGICTLAAMTSIGTLCLLTANMGDAMTYAGSLGMGSPSEGAQAVSIGPGTYIWAALYEGSYTADTLPTYQPKGYAAELAACRWCYKPIAGQTSCIFSATEQAGRYFGSSINFEPMRITPTVTFDRDGDGKIAVVQGVGFVDESEFDFAYVKNGVLLPSTTNAAYAGKVMSFYGIRLSSDP